MMSISWMYSVTFKLKLKLQFIVRSLWYMFDFAYINKALSIGVSYS